MMIQGVPRGSSIFPSFPNPIRGAANRLQGTISTLNKCVEDAIAAAPYAPIVLIGGGISVVKGLGAMSEHWKESSAELDGGARPGGVASVPSLVSPYFSSAVLALVPYICSSLVEDWALCAGRRAPEHP